MSRSKSVPSAVPPAVPPPPTAKPHGAAGCLARIVWMVAGNVALAFVLMGIAQRREGFWSVADIVYWGVALLTALVRYLDVRFFAGDTVTGDRATMAHWRRYALVLAAVTAVAWGIAHLIGRPR